MPLSKAPSQNIFSLDPVKTTLTAPTTNVAVQGPENRSRANAQFARGLQGFATSLGNLGNLAKERQRTADIKLAEEAAIRGDLRPDSVFKEADTAQLDRFNRFCALAWFVALTDAVFAVLIPRLQTTLD